MYLHSWYNVIITKKENIKNYIISAIVSNKIKIGKNIPSENHLCELFKISRNPVREALKELSYQNWIHPHWGMGYSVQGLGSYESLFVKKTYKSNSTKIRKLRKDEKKFLILINDQKINNPKQFVKEYFDGKKLIIKTINFVTNDYLFYLSKKEIRDGFIKSLIQHKIKITHQNKQIHIINLDDFDVKKMGWKDDYPVIITSLYEQKRLIEKSVMIFKKSHFMFEKKIIF